VLQTFDVLELVKPGTAVRGHFAQSLGTAQRAAGRYRLAGHWEPVEPGGHVVSRLLGSGGQELARVVTETLEYT
jgi:hypothetical protein